MRYELWFYGMDGEFSYMYGEFSHVALAFRTPRLSGLDWTFDGDGWSSSLTIFPEAVKVGRWYITWED